MIVADTNLIAYLILTGEKTELARQVYAVDSHWIAPTLWQHEFLNVLATNVRHEMLTIEGALQAWENSQNIMFGREQSVTMSTALRLSAAYKISAYDAQYIALAQTAGCWLVTEDKKLLKAFPENARSMQMFLDGMREDG